MWTPYNQQTTFTSIVIVHPAMLCLELLSVCYSWAHLLASILPSIVSMHRQPLYVDMIERSGRWTIAYRSAGPSARYRSMGPNSWPGRRFVRPSWRMDRWYAHIDVPAMRAVRDSYCIFPSLKACEPTPRRSRYCFSDLYVESRSANGG